MRKEHFNLQKKFDFKFESNFNENINLLTNVINVKSVADFSQVSFVFCNL